MLIDLHAKLTPEKRKDLEAKIELTLSIKSKVKELYDYHIANSKKWYPHLVVPWGAGHDYVEKEWKEEQAGLKKEVRIALETNLLTEDNLPYYHAELARYLSDDPIWGVWNRRWTAEEGKHAAAIRDYLYLTRNFDPVEMEDNRQLIMESGFTRPFDPISIFVYTTVQELATRVAHINTGRAADEPVIKALLTHVSNDENFHFIFYRGVVKAMLEQAPELVLPSVVEQIHAFAMPGSSLPDFKQRMDIIADLEIYGPAQHRDQVIKPLLKSWEIDKLTGLSPEMQKVQEQVMGLITLLDRVVERRERKKNKSA